MEEVIISLESAQSKGDNPYIIRDFYLPVERKKSGRFNYFMNAAANPLNANVIALPAWANAPLPAHATVFPEPAHAAFVVPVASI